MLTAMTLALALAHAGKQQPFNGLFYATAATLIPVLFLALAVQGNTFERLLDVALRGSQSIHPGMPARSAQIAGARSLLALAAAYGVLAYSVIGEISAAVALCDRRGGSGTSSTVLVSVITLTIAVAAGPALRLRRTYSEGMSRRDPAGGSGAIRVAGDTEAIDQPRSLRPSVRHAAARPKWAKRTSSQSRKQRPQAGAQATSGAPGGS
jgi:hypothetical protein